MLPALVAGVLWLAGLLDLDPVGRVQVVSLAFAAWSTINVWVAYRWAGHVGGPAASMASAGLSIASIEMAHFAPHPLGETLATPLLLWGLYLAFRTGAPEQAGARRSCGIAAGVLIALAVFLRFQLAPAAAIGVLWLTWRDLRGRFLPLAVAATCSFLAAGALDWLTLGAPFQSIWLYVYLNIAEGVAAHFGVAPWHRYIAWLRSTWEPLFLPILGLALLDAWRAPPHALGAAIAGAGLVAAIALEVLPPSRNRWTVGTAPGAFMRQINADRAACGVAIHPWDLWGAAAGYAYLRPGIQLYAFSPAADRRQLDAFNFIYAAAEWDMSPAGYARLACRTSGRNGLCLWRREGGCDSAASSAASSAVKLVLPPGIPGRAPAP